MKMIRIRNIFIFSLFFFSHICMAQWSDEDLKPYKQTARQEADKYVGQMIRSGKWDREDDRLKIEFVTDTMKIETVVRLLENGGKYSTMNMHNTLSFQMGEYDKLLNKYYKALLGKLIETDKAKLREAQRTWLKYRDSEFKINKEMVAPNTYMGGGTMWPIVAGSRSLDIVKERVLSLYNLHTTF